MKYAIIDQIKNGDWFDELFDTEEQAIRKADHEWNVMTLYDKNRRETYCVAQVKLDDDGCVDYAIGFTPIKEYK